MSRSKVVPLALAMTLMLALAACGGDDDTGDAADADPTGTWTLTSGTFEGAEVPIVADAPITVVIAEDGTMSGTSACNQYSGGSVDGDTVSAAQIAGTMMACSDEIMESESAYLAALASVDSIAVDGDTLTLTGPDTTLEFTAAAATDG